MSEVLAWLAERGARLWLPMAETQTQPGDGPGRGGDCFLGKKIVAEDTTEHRQRASRVAPPSFSEAWPAWSEQIRFLPAPASELSPARDWVCISATVATTRMIAVLMGVTPRAVCYWRAGQRRPRWRHKRKLMMLQAVVRRAGS